jgi:hypothetical protein
MGTTDIYVVETAVFLLVVMKLVSGNDTSIILPSGLLHCFFDPCCVQQGKNSLVIVIQATSVLRKQMLPHSACSYGSGSFGVHDETVYGG